MDTKTHQMNRSASPANPKRNSRKNRPASMAAKQRAAKVNTGLGLILGAMGVGVAAQVLICLGPAAVLLGVMLGLTSHVLAISGLVKCLNAPRQAGRGALEASLAFCGIASFLLLIGLMLSLLAGVDARAATAQAMQAAHGKMRIAQYANIASAFSSLLGWGMMIEFLRCLSMGLKSERLAKRSRNILFVAAALALVLVTLAFDLPQDTVLFGVLPIIVALTAATLVMQIGLLAGLRSRLNAAISRKSTTDTKTPKTQAGIAM